MVDWELKGATSRGFHGFLVQAILTFAVGNLPMYNMIEQGRVSKITLTLGPIHTYQLFISIYIGSIPDQ